MSMTVLGFILKTKTIIMYSYSKTIYSAYVFIIT